MSRGFLLRIQATQIGAAATGERPHLDVSEQYPPGDGRTVGGLTVEVALLLDRLARRPWGEDTDPDAGLLEYVRLRLKKRSDRYSDTVDAAMMHIDRALWELREAAETGNDGDAADS